jgi:PknH-like extracellular domain
MNSQVRSTIVAVGLAILATGCGRDAISEPRGVPTRPTSLGQPVAAQAIDSLIIPVEQVPGGLHDNHVDKQPTPDSGSSDFCRHVYTSTGHPGAIAYRGVHYSGPSNIGIVQTVEIYSTPADAVAAFRRLADRLNECKSQGGDPVSIDAITPAEAIWHEQGFSPSKGSQETMFATDVRTAKNVVFAATPVHFSDSPTESRQVANSVADQIATKIENTL